MEFKRPTCDQLELGLRALRCVAMARGRALGERERAMLGGMQRFFCTNFDVDRLREIGPGELADKLTDPQIRRQLVDALIAFSVVDGEADLGEAALVTEYARALDVDEKAVRKIERLARHEVFGLRIDVLRRLWAVDELRERVHEYGLGDVLRFVKANVGRLEDRWLAVRFRTLRELPDGTLGREYIRFLDDNGWPVPGEDGALSDIIVPHDLTHVLAGYGTDPVGEIETACFSAGYRKKEPFIFVLFVLLQFHTGAGITPRAPTRTGYFDVERALAALERGAGMNIDLTCGWDYWDDMETSVAELRRRYGIGRAAHPQRAAS